MHPPARVALTLTLGLSLLGSVLPPTATEAQEVSTRNVTLTCDRDLLDRDSYDMATIGQATTLLEPRSDFWDRFIVNKHIDTLHDLNFDVLDLAERARDLDPRNMMAHSILARQYLILGRERAAEVTWRNVVDHGGVVAWTATLYDVDYKSYFVLTFGRDALRIYRMGQFTGPIKRHMGIAQFPEPSEVAFYEATAGCPDPGIAPVAVVPWSNVKEVKAGNWVLWFKLDRPVTVVSDRDKKKSLREIKVNLHGETGEVKFLAEENPDWDPRWDEESDRWKNVRGIGLGPYDYQHRVRDMILRFAESQNQIKRTSAGRGAGW